MCSARPLCCPLHYKVSRILPRCHLMGSRDVSEKGEQEKGTTKELRFTQPIEVPRGIPGTNLPP